MAREVDALVEFTKVVTSDFQFQVDMSIPRHSTAAALERLQVCILVIPSMLLFLLTNFYV